jgi:hypothetical protein
VVYLSDGFLKLKPGSSATAAGKFFSIATRFPLELQMILCNRVHGLHKDLVLTKYSEPAFKKLARKSSWKHQTTQESNF